MVIYPVSPFLGTLSDKRGPCFLKALSFRKANLYVLNNDTIAVDARS